MNLWKPVRVIFGIIKWGVIALTLLFIFIIAALQFSSVQQFIIGKATRFVSAKTHTRVEIGRVDIAFPKKIVLKNVFLDDLKHDTLLYAGNIKVDISMFALLSKKLQLNSVSLEHLVSHIERTNTADSAFNFSFLMKAFAGDSSAKKVKKDSTGKPFVIVLKDVSLKDITIKYEDAVTGNYIKGKLGELELTMRGFDLGKPAFDIKSVAISNTSLTVLQTKNDTTHSETKTTLPAVNVGVIKLNGIAVEYANNATDMQLKLWFGDCFIDAKNVNLPESKIALNSIKLSTSSFAMIMKKDTPVKQTKQSNTITLPAWNITLGDLNIADIKFSMDYSNLSKSDKGIDFNHLSLTGIRVALQQLNYDAGNITMKVQQLAASEQSGIELKNFRANVEFDSTHAALKQLYLETEHSIISDELSVSYSSLNSLTDSIGE